MKALILKNFIITWGYSESIMRQDAWRQSQNYPTTNDDEEELHLPGDKIVECSNITERYLNLVCNNNFSTYCQVKEGIAHILSPDTANPMTESELTELERLFK